MLRSVIEYILEPWVKAIRYIFIGRGENHIVDNLVVSYMYFLSITYLVEYKGVMVFLVSLAPAISYTILVILIKNALDGISKKQTIRRKMEAQRGDISAV